MHLLWEPQRGCIKGKGFEGGGGKKPQQTCSIRELDQKTFYRTKCIVLMDIFLKEKAIFSRDKLDFSHHLKQV